MRQKQRLYDRNHSPGSLREARDWERIVDAEIDRVEEIIREKERQRKIPFPD